MVKVSHHEWWYIKRLQKYYNEHYSQYEDSVEWFGNPLPNQWRFWIPELGCEVYLTCDDKGKVTEEIKYPAPRD